MTWNTADLTSRALRHLVEGDQGCSLRLLVHDNASTDGTPDVLSAVVPEAEVEVSRTNQGIARGVNRLLARSEAPWFLALNSDAWPEEGAIPALVAAAEARPDVAAVAPLLLRPDGTVEHSTHPFPGLAVALLDAVAGRSWLPRAWQEQLCLEGAWRHDRGRQVDWAVGAALLFRRSAIDQLGGLDERFFMYVEDLEWCWRARHRGWSVLFEPAAVVRHVGNVSGESRFGEGRAALEAANVNLFLSSVKGPAIARSYRVLTGLGLARMLASARLRGHAEEAGYWRHLLRTCVGLVPPPPIDADLDDAGSAAGTVSDVAVVVSTRNRADRLRRLVDALEAQTLPSGAFEVVIVDDGSTDETSTLLDDLAARASVPLKVVHRTERGGAAAGRNVGWRSTQASLIAFTDDDCVPSPRWLEEGVDALKDGAGVAVGRTEAPPDQAALSGRPFSLALNVTSTQFLETCNVIYRREDLERVGGLDERFRRPSGEDTDLGLRVLALGRTAVFVDKAVVYHDVRTRTALQAVLESFRWRDLPLVVRGRPWARRRLLHRWLFWKPAHPWAILALVGLALGTRKRAALLLVLPWFDHRWRVDPTCPERGRRLVTLPAAFAVDASEVATLAWGSIRHRTLLL